MGPSCPVCKEPLSSEKGKMTLRVEACPRGHGTFVDAQRLGHLVDESTSLKILALGRQAAGGGPCASCGDESRRVELGGLTTCACPSCGGLWFPEGPLLEYYRAWRTRAYGQDAFSARTDVLDEANKLHTAEVIAGVLTEFELSIEEEIQ